MVARLQKEVEEFRAESVYGGSRRSAIPPQPSGWSGFASTPVPMLTGKTSWDQYRQVFEAIVSSNGWDGVTAALQLVSHLEGDTLNVALLVPDRWSAPSVDIWIVWSLALLSGILWTDAVCGRAMPRTRTVGEPAPFRIGLSRPIGLMMWGRKVAWLVIRKIMTC